MSSTNAPFGLRPAFHPSGLDRAQALAGGIASAYSVDILKGQPVKLNTSGVIVVAAAGDSFQGAFAGVEFTDTTGRRRVSNSWPANTAYQTGSCVAYSLAGSGASAQMRIVDLAPYPDNAWGDAYTIVRATINESQFQATVNAI